MAIVTFSTFGENSNEFHGGLWTAESDIKLESPASLCDMVFYIEGEGRTEQEAIEALILNLKARGISGKLRRQR